MKTIFKLLMIMGLTVILFGCDNDEEIAPNPPAPEAEELTQQADPQVQVNYYMDQVRSLGFGAPGAVLQDGVGFRAGRSEVSSWSRMRSFMNGTSRKLDDGICVAQIFVLNDDGGFSWIIDFGDGCEIDGEFWKGKVVETYQIDEEAGTYTALVGFENFGQSTWTIDGLAALEGTYVDGDDFSTSFTFVKNLEIRDEDEYWDIELIGSETLDAQAWTVEQMAANIQYESPEEQVDFANLVITPLVYDFNCGEEIITFVSGIDAIKANELEFLLLFGEGSCDNLVTVKQGIVEVEVDVSENPED